MKRFLILLILTFELHNAFALKKGLQNFCVAVVQLKSSEVGNFAIMDAYAKSAKMQGASLIIFPEESLFGWLNPIVFQKAKPIPGQYSDAFAMIAMRNNIWVATGIAEQGPQINPIYYQAYDSGILINPSGKIVLHHRKYNVLKNAFDQCPPPFGQNGCSYTPGPLSDIQVVNTPFGRTAILVCADAYTYDLTSLKILKTLNPQFVIINWGVTAAVIDSCGKASYNATSYAAAAAKFLGTAFVIGANATGNRPYGRFRPSCYCGTSGFATPNGLIGGIANITESMHLFYIPTPTKATKKRPMHAIASK